MKDVCEEELITNAGACPSDVESTDNNPHGVDVAIPTLPVTPTVCPPRIVKAGTDVVANDTAEVVEM